MVTKRVALAVAAAGLCWSLGVADARAQSTIATWTLDNGLTVAHARRQGSPLVSVQVWVRAGTREEPTGKRGVARLFEHLMFSGSARVRDGDHRRFIEATGGFADAFVIEDAAAFNNTVPVQHLDLVLELEADRLRNLLIRGEVVDQAKLKVKEAIRRSQGSAFFRALVAFLGVAYSKHPYGHTAAGTEADVDAVTIADAHRFYTAHYAPHNALVVVVGDVDEKTVRASVDRHFAPIPKAEKAPSAAANSEPAQTAARREQTAWPAGIGFVVAGYHIPAAVHDDIYALQVASLLLARGETGRLRKRFDGNKLVRGASAEALVREHPGLFVVYAAFGVGANAAEIEKGLISELDKLVKTAPPAKELDRARNQLAGTLALTLESTTGFARQIGQSWVLTGKPQQFMADLAAFDKVTPQAVQAATKNYFTAANRTIVVVTPGGGGQ